MPIKSFTLSGDQRRRLKCRLRLELSCFALKDNDGDDNKSYDNDDDYDDSYGDEDDSNRKKRR